jgi:hypothetical protein
MAAKAKAWRQKNPDHSRADNLKKYGLAVEQYDAMSDAQGGICSICFFDDGMPQTRRLAVDHDHQTGNVRGLLCTRCNLAIGYARDDPSLLRAMARYLEGN